MRDFIALVTGLVLFAIAYQGFELLEELDERVKMQTEQLEVLEYNQAVLARGLTVCFEDLKILRGAGVSGE